MADPIDCSWMTTRDVADVLGVSVRFVVEEIRDGRLRALCLEGRKRVVYRITPDDYRAYIRERWRPALRNDQRQAS